MLLSVNLAFWVFFCILWETQNYLSFLNILLQWSLNIFPQTGASQWKYTLDVHLWTIPNVLVSG